MDVVVNKVSLKKAPLSAFRLMKSPILQGKALEEIKRIEKSIVQYGLICPIVTSRLRNTLIVIDGKKRVQAIQRLAFRNELPEKLVHIPFISILESRQKDYPADSIISRKQLYKTVMTLRTRNISLEAIAEYLSLCRNTISDVVLLSRLSERVRNAYFDNGLSFSVARAYASIPNTAHQSTLMLQLGKSADETTILNAIETICAINVTELNINEAQVKKTKDDAPLSLTKAPRHNFNFAVA